MCGTGDDFCGNGCQSGSCQGGAENEVFIDPQIFTKPDMTLQCFPPCTFVLPPQTLSTATTISIPPVTETIEETWPLTTVDGSVSYTTITKTVIITIPVFTTSVVDYSNIIWSESSSGSSASTDVYMWSSILPPGVTLTETTDDQSTPIVWTYSFGPWPTAISTQSPNETPDPTLVGGVFPVHSGRPGPICTANCGGSCRGSCGPPGLPPPPHISIPCIGPGCGGGGGGGNCVGQGCGGRGGGGGAGGGGDGDPTSCESTKTASQCAVVCTTTAGPEPCSTTCFGIQGCGDVRGTTTTVTKITDVPAPWATMPPNNEWGPGDLDLGAIKQRWEAMEGDLAKFMVDKYSIDVPDTPTNPPRDEGLYCYRDHNEDGKWKAFKDTDAHGAYMPICNSDIQLMPDGWGMIGGENGMFVSLKWADDQSGCKSKKAFMISDHENCHEQMGTIGVQCDSVGEAENKAYGGLYRHNGENGCVEYIIRRT